VAVSFPGHELRARRLELSLSLDKASAGCALPIAMIEALENGDLDRLPAACYTVGFIRSYCRQLGLEPEYYVGALHVAINGGSSVKKQRGSTIGDLLQRLPIPTLPGISPEFQAWGLVIVVTLVGWAAYSAVFNPAAPHSAPQAQAATIDLRLPDDFDRR
jgi:cytoskeleton protein RodZ